MLARNFIGAFFSLDEVDPDKPYHPFNTMRFGPAQLYGSEFLNAMLFADYLLKFLTTNREVQGGYPYGMRSVDHLISHLPEYLQKIITDFHEADHSGMMHRFWIEAESVDVINSDENQLRDGVHRIALENMKMVIKKHLMTKDARGNLIDANDGDEGWPIYLLTLEEKSELDSGIRKIDGHAMVFVQGELKVYFWEYHEEIKVCVPEDFCEIRARLYKQHREPSGLVKRDGDNANLFYCVIRKVSEQARISHRYSSEYIFAYEFTVHYDEFAQYLPIFGRLKELSKMTVLIRNLNEIRRGNKEQLEALMSLVSNPDIESASISDSYRQYKDEYLRLYRSIKTKFKEWQEELSFSILLCRHQSNLQDMRKGIGVLKFDVDSSEVREACQRLYDQVQSDNPMISSYRIWDEVVNPKKYEIAEMLSSSKQNSVRKQLVEIFSSKISSITYNELNQYINHFFSWNIEPLARSCANYERSNAERHIHSQFFWSSLNDIQLALNGNEGASSRIAKETAIRELVRVKKGKQQIKLGFQEINLGLEKQEGELSERCHWVPAAVRHEVSAELLVGRHSFFVYGGVSVQPKQTFLYQKLGPNGEHLKYGITKNPATRYTSEQLGGGELKILASGGRSEMLSLERDLHSHLPIGPEERQKCYIEIQRAKGYRIPPY